jgi:membrane protein
LLGWKTSAALLKETLDEWWDDRASELAAALAFYTVFSFAPLLIIVIAMVSMVFGREAVRTEVVSYFQSVIGYRAARLVVAVLEQSRQQSSLATVAGIGTSLFGATVVFAELQDALNTIWEVTVKPGKTVKIFFRKRLLSFMMVLGIGILLVVFLVATAALSAVAKFLGSSLPMPALVLQAGNFVISFTITTILFAVIYKVLPDVRITWQDVWTGAAATSLLFTIGKTLIGVYLAYSGAGSAYGAAGSFVVMLLWVYYSAQIFFLGAEFTQVYARHRGAVIEPDKNAVRFARTIES